MNKFYTFNYTYYIRYVKYEFYQPSYYLDLEKKLKKIVEDFSYSPSQKVLNKLIEISKETDN